MWQNLEQFARQLRRNLLLQKSIRAERKQIAQEFEADLSRFLTHGSPKDSHYLSARAEFELTTQADRDVHRVEKGLALRSPKRPFGVDLRNRLEFLFAKLPSTSGTKEEVNRAIVDLDNWNNQGEVSAQSAEIYRHYQTPGEFDLHDFFWARKSIRVFSPSPVARELIVEAVELARNSPSVCNRQSWNVYAVDDNGLLSDVLPLQNGNESFRQEIPTALVITSDLHKFSGAGERNQAWIDGGLFAMSLVWALHGLSLGSCMLNWSVTNSQSKKLRDKLEIPENEEIIMMMAVGHPEVDIRYAKSQKRSASDILHWRDS